jgi:hypothetical protein
MTSTSPLSLVYYGEDVNALKAHAHRAARGMHFGRRHVSHRKGGLHCRNCRAPDS